jgi:energy-coupling factor transporter ATP-binding protein EcfA2
LDNFHQQYKRICKDSKEIAKIITSRAKLKATPFEKISRITFSGEKHELTINVGNDRLVYISKNEVSFSENKALSFQYEHSSNHIPYDYCEESSTLDEVRAFFGVNDFDLLKILAHIAISYLETEHKALLNIYGPKGVGKSTLARKIMSVANPSKSINTFPYRRNDFCEIAHKGGMLTFDNLSKIDKTMSDLMATTITGSEEEVRKHFRQNQTIKYVLFSSITITSIDNCVTESDLNDRSFAIHLFEREYLFKDFPPPKLGKVVNFIFQMLSKILLLKEHGRFISDSRQNRKNSWLELVANAVGIDFSDYQGEECRQNVENEVKSILQDVVAVAILDKLNNSNGAIEGYVSDFYRNLHSERVGSLYYVQNQELARIGIREFCKRIRNINFKLIGVQVDGPARRKTRDRRGEYVQIFWMKEDVQKATVTNISHYKENRISQKFQEAVELIVDKLGLNNSNDKNGMIRTSIKSAVCGIDAEIIVDTFSIIHLTEEEQLVYRNPVKLHELIKNRGVR